MNLYHDIYVPNCDFFRLAQDERCDHINILTSAVNRLDANVRQLANFIEPYVEIELDKQRRNIFKILCDYKYIDISEEEFVKLLEED